MVFFIHNDCYSVSLTATVKYKMEVTGETFGANLQLLQKVETQLLRLEESTPNQDYQVIFVFCPIISRIGTDVDAAMHKVTGKRFFC